MIRTLARFNVKGERRGGPGRHLGRPRRRTRGQDRRHRRAHPPLGDVHGVALNVEPDLEHFAGIVPCGIGPSIGVTSLLDLGIPVSMAELDMALGQPSTRCSANSAVSRRNRR